MHPSLIIRPALTKMFAIVLLGATLSLLHAAPLTPDANHMGWGKWPKRLEILAATHVNSVPYGTGGVEFGVIVTGTYDNPVSEVFVVNRRPDFDASVKIDTRAGVLSGNCPRMSYLSLGTVNADVTRYATKDAIVTKGPWGRNTPLRENEPKREKKSSISRGDMKLIEDQLKSAPVSAIKDKLIERLFGKAVSRNFSIIYDMIDPVMLADGTMDAQLRRWRSSCEQFIQQEKDRAARVQESLNIIARANAVMRTTRDPVQYAVAERTKQDVTRIGMAEAQTAQRNLEARQWCEGLLESIPKPSNHLP